jgi:hypothetical protein
MKHEKNYNRWQIWKHALGSFSEQDGYEKKNDNAITYIRTFIVVSNLICAYVIMANIIVSWIV